MTAPNTSPWSRSVIPQPLFDGSYQWPVRSTSLMVPDSTKGLIVHVPCAPSTTHDACICSKWFTVRRMVPTLVERAIRVPPHSCFCRFQTPPRLDRGPCAVYQVGTPLMS